MYIYFLFLEFIDLVFLTNNVCMHVLCGILHGSYIGFIGKTQLYNPPLHAKVGVPKAYLMQDQSFEEFLMFSQFIRPQSSYFSRKITKNF